MNLRKSSVVKTITVANVMSLFLCTFIANFCINEIFKGNLLNTVAKGSSVKPHYYSCNVTRRQAIIDFVAALQMKDGGFVTTLTAPEEEEGVVIAREAVKVLSVLGSLNAIDTEALISYIVKCQTDNGGFVGTLIFDVEPEIAVAADVAYILYRLDAFDRIDRGAFLKWVLGCYHWEDGRFSYKPDEEDYLVFHTVLGVFSLFWMGELSRIDIGKTTQYILSCYCEDGGFSSLPGETNSNIYDTYWCMLALLYLGALNRINIEKTVNYWLNYYDFENQTFIGGGDPLPNCAYGVLALNMLGALDKINKTKMVELILSCQSPLHGGFTSSPETIYDENEENIGSTMNAIEMLEALDALGVLDENFTVLHKPIWHGEPYEPHERNEQGEEGDLTLNLTFLDYVVISVCIGSLVGVYMLLKREKKRLARRKTKDLKSLNIIYIYNPVII